MRIEFVDFVAGAQRVVPVAGIEEAIALKRRHGDWLLLGERHAKPLTGFDGGNSPAHLAHQALAGRTVIHTTHAGTQGLAAGPGRSARRATSVRGRTRQRTCDGRGAA